MKGIRKILTFSLAILMCLSLSMTISATGSDIEATQNTDGDLVITANTDDAKTLIQKIYDGVGDRAGSARIYVTVNDLYRGVLMNVHDSAYDKEYIEKDGDNKLIIKKQTLIDCGFVNGTWKLSFSEGNGSGYKYENITVTMANLNNATPNIATKLKLEGKISAPVEGASTEIDETGFKLLNQDNTKIAADDFSIYWGEEKTLDDDKQYLLRTSDDTFVAGKTYYLVVVYGYVYGKDDATEKVDFEYEYGTLKKEERQAGAGATLGSGLFTENYRVFSMECIAGKLVKDDTENKGTAPRGIKISNTVSELENIITLTDEEKGKLDAKKNINIQLVVSDVSSDINADDATKAKEKVKELGLSENTLVYDIKLTATVDEQGASARQIETTNSAISINFPLVDELVNKDSSVNREYYVIRVHDSVAEKIDATYNEKTKSITFKTDKFSTYAIAYKDTKKPTTSTKSYDSKDKNQDGVIDCSEEMNSNNWVWSNTKKACVYKVSNTSTK